MSWNCCGLGNPQTVLKLKDICAKSSPDILFLSETRNEDGFVLKELEPLRLESYFLVSPSATSGRGLALLWKKELNIQILDSNPNFIDTQISFKQTTFNGTFVYGAPEIPNMQAVWDGLSTISETRDSPWFRTWDFNEITNNSEKSGGRERPESSFTAFRSFLSMCDLFDLKHTGNFLSWRGKRHTHLVNCRLDRAMANSSWSDLFPNGRSHYLPFEGSDHRPLLSTFDSKMKKQQKAFRYDKRLRDNTEVSDLVEKAWLENPNLDVSARISKCRHIIATWSKRNYINSQRLIEELRRSLDVAMTDNLADDLLISSINQKLLAAYRDEEEFWKQRSR